MVIFIKIDKLSPGKILTNSDKLLVDFGKSVFTLNKSLKVYRDWGVVFVGMYRCFLSVKGKEADSEEDLIGTSLDKIALSPITSTWK